MKKLIGVVVLSLFFLFLGYRMIFSYHLVSFSGFGTEKHKIYNVFEFPRTVFNPFRITGLRRKVEFFCQVNDLRYDHLFQRDLSVEGAGVFNKNYIESFKAGVGRNEIQLVSIKNVEGEEHLLTRLGENLGATMVFVLRKDSIVGFY